MAQDWDLSSLKTRRGGPRRLLGLKIYYDFRWADVFPDDRSQFRNGLSLARHAQKEAPAGKQPALLLTVDGDADRTPIETDDECILVVRIRDYLKLAHADAAATYFAGTVGLGLASLTRFSELADSPDLLQLFFNENLTTERIEQWASADPTRLAQLAEAVGEQPGHHRRPPVSLAEAIQSVEEIDDVDWKALLDTLPRITRRNQRDLLLKVMMDDPEGRRDAILNLREQVPQRIEDLERASDEFDELLRQGSTESALHGYLESNPWLLGMDYVKVRQKVSVPRGQLDFVVDRYDGFFDVLELKGSQDEIVSGPDEIDGIPPSPSKYRLSRGLAAALAQVHFYREVLVASHNVATNFYGLSPTRFPRFIIVIGRVESLSQGRRKVLEQLNQTLHRVEVIPYDLVARKAKALITNLRSYLGLGS